MRRRTVHMAGAEVQRGFDRFVFFCDAVVAIAVTLLIANRLMARRALRDQRPKDPAGWPSPSSSLWSCAQLVQPTQPPF